MSFKLASLGLCLLVVQSGSRPQPDEAQASKIVVEVGGSPMNGNWYQDGVSHDHDKLRLVHAFDHDGNLEVTIGSPGSGGTDLKFVFSHDADHNTLVSATAREQSDVRLKDPPRTRPLTELSGRVLVQTNDWGLGKTLNASFAVRGKLERSPQLLLGTFSLLLRG